MIPNYSLSPDGIEKFGNDLQPWLIIHKCIRSHENLKSFWSLEMFMNVLKFIPIHIFAFYQKEVCPLLGGRKTRSYCRNGLPEVIWYFISLILSSWCHNIDISIHAWHTCEVSPSSLMTIILNSAKISWTLSTFTCKVNPSRESKTHQSGWSQIIHCLQIDLHNLGMISSHD